MHRYIAGWERREQEVGRRRENLGKGYKEGVNTQGLSEVDWG